MISHSFELGLRGHLASFGGDQKLEWTAGLFRTENTDDILSVNSPQQGRGYFLNAGDTLRQGVELGVIYQERWLQAYANFAFIDATFRTPIFCLRLTTSTVGLSTARIMWLPAPSYDPW